ncbi:zinc finger, CCHC-type containing protein [Tanacetum coccineum]
MAEDASSKKFLVSNVINYKMTDLRPVMEKYNKLLGILDSKHTLKHKKEKLTLVELDSHLRIKESLRVHNSDKPKGNNVVGPSVVNMVEHYNSIRYNENKGKRKHHDIIADPNKKFKDDDVAWLNIVNDNIGSTFMSTSKLNDSILWHARLGHVHFKMMQDMSTDGLIPAFDMDTKKCKTCMLTKITKKPFRNVKCETEVLELIHSDLCDLHATPSLGNKKYFVIVIDDASRTVVRLFDPKLKTLGERGTRDEVSNQHSYCFNVEDDPKLFYEEFKSQDVAFMKEAINDEIYPLDEEVCMNQPQGFIMPGNENKVDLTKELLSSRFSMKDMGEADIIFGEKLIPNNGQAISQLEYSRVIDCLMYVRTYTRPDIAFVMAKLSRYTQCSKGAPLRRQGVTKRVVKYLKKTMDYSLTYTGYPSVLEGYTNAIWISNIEDNSSISGWVFLLGRDTQLPPKETWELSSMWKAKHSGTEAHIYNHPKDVLGTCWKGGRSLYFLMVKFFGKVLRRSMNKEEPPMYMLRFYRLRKLRAFSFYNIYELDMDT